MLEEQKIKIGKDIVKVCVQMARVLGKNDFSTEDLEKIKKANGYLEKYEWVLKTIKDDKNVKTN